MKKIKNLTFPICARRTGATDNNLIGYESIEFLSLMSSFEKKDQYLLFYNFMNEKKIHTFGQHRKPVFLRTNNRSPQTTFVIDFDNLVPSVSAEIDRRFEAFNNALNQKAIMVVSPSGNRHVIYVIRGRAPEDFYQRLQTVIIDTFFKSVESFIDKPSSMSIHRGFYHSQHLAHWIKNGLINATPSLQKKRGFFWNNSIVLNFAELYEILDDLQPIEKRKSYELVDDARRVLDYLQHISRGTENEEKVRNSERLCRILAELRSREKEKREKYTEKIIHRAKTEQYQAANECIQRLVSEDLRRSETVREILREMAEGDGSAGSSGHSRSDSQDSVSSGVCELQGSSSTGDGCGDSRSFGHDGIKGRGYRDDSSDESLLGSLSNIRDALEARGVRLKELGDRLFQNTLRSHGHRDSCPEESDIGIFASIVRDSLDRDPRISRDIAASGERTYIWLRHAGRHLRNEGSSNRVLQEFAADAARCFRLYLKTQNVEINLSGEEFEQKIAVSKTAAINLIQMAETRLPLLIKDLSKHNRQTAMKLFREKGEFLENGTAAFLTRITELYPLIKEHKPIAVGMEDFQNFFQTHGRKASLLRHVYMGFLGSVWKDHVPLMKRRQFQVDLEIINEIFKSERKTPDSVEEIIMKIGNGRTWSAMKTYIKPMFHQLGLSKTQKIWYDALDLGTANDPELRKKDVMKFLEKLQGTSS